MKIAFVNSLYSPYVIGGAERIVQVLAESFAKKRFEVVVVSLTANCGVQTERVNGVKVYYLGLRNLYWPFHDTSKNPLIKAVWHLADSFNPVMGAVIRDILKEEKPDLVHTNNLSGFSVATWRVAEHLGLKIMHTLHDYYLLCPRSTMYSAGENCHTQCSICRLYSIPRKAYSSRVDAVVGVSHFILDRHMRAGYFPNAIVRQVINNGVESARLAPYQAVSLRPGRLKIGYIGRLEPTKGVELLLAAWEKIGELYSHLFVAGRGREEYICSLRQRYSLRNVEFLGFVTAEDFFSTIDLLVVPSRWEEPMGLVVVEALAYGIPVVGAQRGGIPELIEDGKTGLLFDPEVEHSLETALRRILESPSLLALMKRNARSSAERFGLERMLAQYEDIYLQLIKAAEPYNNNLTEENCKR